MSSPQNPNDPNTLSLAANGGTKQADFSNVQGGSDTVASGKTDFSNVHGGSDSVADDGAGAAQRYTVQQGDTLSHIAKQFYGKANAWNQIFEANRDQLDNPDRIQPGQVLKIPAAQA